MSGVLTRTDLGALTTTFTPPSSCFVPNLYIESESDVIFPEYGQTCSFGASTYDSNCFPPDFGNLYEYQALSSYHAVYSPASICPSGFRSACAFTRTDGPIDAPYSAEREILSALTPGEVDIACCRTGYTCGYEDAIMSCDSQAEDGAKITGTIYDENCEVSTSTITVDSSETDVLDYMVPIHIAINTDSATATPTNKPESPAGRGRSGPPSLIIIIVVVVIALVICIIGLVIFIIRRRRKAKKAVMPPIDSNYAVLPDESNKSGNNDYKNNNIGGGYSHELSAADSFARVPELPTSQTQFVFELPAGEVPRTPTDSQSNPGLSPGPCSSSKFQ